MVAVGLNKSGDAGMAASPAFDWLALLIAGMVGIGISAGVVQLHQVELINVIGIGTGIGIMALILLAAYRVDYFLAAVLVLRPALDDMARDDLGLFQPGSAVGFLLLAVGGIWTMARIRSGRLHPPSFVTKAFAFYAFMITLSGPGSLTPIPSLMGSLKLWSAVVLLVILEQIYQDDRQAIWKLLGASALGLIAPIATAIVQAISTGTVDPVSGLIRIDGPFVHSNPFATYLVVCSLFAAALCLRSSGTMRYVSAIVFFATAPIIILTYARAGWGVLVLGLMLIGIRLDRRIFAGLVLAGVLMVAANPSILTRLTDLTAADDPNLSYENPNSLEWRVGYWFEVLPLGYSNPVTGMGLDTVELVTDVQLPPHNSFVQAFVEAGILGLTGILTAVFATARLMVWSLRRFSTGLEGAIATGAAAASLSIFLQLFTENLVTGVIPLWYLTIPVAWLSAERLNSSVNTRDVREITQTKRIGN